jgi:hypothetical protein
LSKKTDFYLDLTSKGVIIKLAFSLPLLLTFLSPTPQKAGVL